MCKNMKPTIKSGKHFANHCKMTGSRFADVCLGDAEFDNVSLAGAKFHNINFSDAVITAANFGGVTFRHIGPAPDEAGNHPPQRPVLFTDADFNSSKFEKVNLENVEINNCNIKGLKVDGILLSDLISEYNAKNSRSINSADA
ncbi:MAG: pentapeptide repeat-containing protein [Planctomycetota bacterium]